MPSPPSVIWILPSGSSRAFFSHLSFTYTNLSSTNFRTFCPNSSLISSQGHLWAPSCQAWYMYVYIHIHIYMHVCSYPIWILNNSRLLLEITLWASSIILTCFLSYTDITSCLVFPDVFHKCLFHFTLCTCDFTHMWMCRGTYVYTCMWRYVKDREPWVLFLRTHCFMFLPLCFGLEGQQAPESACFHLLSGGITSGHHHGWFSQCGFWGINSGLHACKRRVL